MPGVALFDMDRTLVRRNTAQLYVRYQRKIGEATWADTARVAYWMVQYTLGVVDAEGVARRALLPLAFHNCTSAKNHRGFVDKTVTQLLLAGHLSQWDSRSSDVVSLSGDLKIPSVIFVATSRK